MSNDNQAERELLNDLKQVEMEDEKGGAVILDPVKPKLDIEHYAVKSLYGFKKKAQVAYHSRGAPEAIKSKLSHLSKVEDREAEIIKRLIDRYGSNNLSPEWIELINKHLNTEIWLWLEMEWEQNEKMRITIQNAIKDLEK